LGHFEAATNKDPGGDLGVKDAVNNEIMIFKYTILAKGDSATPVHQAFIR
jgi:hypothetical protein